MNKNDMMEMRREANKKALDRTNKVLEAVKADAAVVTTIDTRDSLVKVGDYSSYFPCAGDTKHWRWG